MASADRRTVLYHFEVEHESPAAPGFSIDICRYEYWYSNTPVYGAYIKYGEGGRRRAAVNGVPTLRDAIDRTIGKVARLRASLNGLREVQAELARQGLIDHPLW